ncbi:histidine phosphatase family protein [Paenibacillus glycinis]|uniref:Histidine phosphatase family protein n=1 Tax=Paenibacillus glycinis TaxID=2697035 RepID=A0ABW9XQJ5_9BACL|nr:histidine phosphatase family protein [Paenibacillus glycinis]NBD24686.1 histidine phosphatase family protein [Paenibacillus glycinis]
MDTDFYLVRHGKKEPGTGDVPLSTEGISQAQATARHFRAMRIHRIVSSPLLRSAQTAVILAKETVAQVSEDIRLRERANWGDLPGQTFEAFVESWERCTLERDFSPPAGDSARKAGERLASCLSDLAAEHPGETILLVTHGGLITDFLVNVIPEAALMAIRPNFIAEQSKLVSECSITIVSCRNGTFALRDFASVNHLP